MITIVISESAVKSVDTSEEGIVIAIEQRDGTNTRLKITQLAWEKIREMVFVEMAKGATPGEKV